MSVHTPQILIAALISVTGFAAKAADPLPANPLAGSSLSGESTSVLDNEHLRLDVDFGAVYLQGTEYVNPGDGPRLSQLDWKSTTPVLNLHAELRDDSGYSLRLSGSVGINGSGTMVDRDWIPPYTTGEGDGDWSHRSQSSTTLNQYFKLDAGIGYDLWTDKEGEVTAIGGLRYERTSWTANGGNYVYSVNGFRDAVGSFDPVPVGAYDQYIPSLYAGFSGTANYDGWSLSGELTGGVVDASKLVDHHYLRDFYIQAGPVGLTPSVAASARVAYHFTPDFEAFLNGAVSNDFIMQSTETQTSSTTGQAEQYDSYSFGGSLFTASLTAGARWRF